MVEEQYYENKIKNYRYVGLDDSIICNVYYAICYRILEYIPKWLSPNIITLCGLAAVMASTMLLFMFSWLLSFGALAGISALCLLTYQLCDTLDGRQAKRLNMYHNATTELFDHCCDSIVLTFSFFNSIYIFGLNNIPITIGTVLMSGL